MTLAEIAAKLYEAEIASYYVNFLGEVYSNDLNFIEKVAKQGNLFYQKSDIKDYKYMVKPLNYRVINN